MSTKLGRAFRATAMVLSGLALYGIIVTPLLLNAHTAHACGVCHGDKIGAVYDHATVTKANAEGLAVAFADVEGGFMNQDEAGIAKMRAAVDAEKGVRKEFTKISSSPTAVAFVFNPADGDVTARISGINQRLSLTLPWKLTLMRVIAPKAQ